MQLLREQRQQRLCDRELSGDQIAALAGETPPGHGADPAPPPVESSPLEPTPIEPPPVEPPPPPPPGDGLEPVNTSAVQVAIAVGSTPRQTWDCYGWGVGGSSPAVPGSLVITNADKLFDELGTRVLRYHNPEVSNFAAIWKTISDLAISRGVDRMLATGYVYRGGSTPTSFANAVARVIDGGIPITHVSLQNEPDGNVGNAITESRIVPDHTTLRSGLDALGLKHVKVLGYEWAHFTGTEANRSSEREFDRLKEAGAAGPNKIVQIGAGHCYKHCPAPSIYDNRWMTVGGVLWSTETGNMGGPTAQARFVAALNHGAAAEITHIGQLATRTPSNEQLAQVLVEANGTRRPWHGALCVISQALPRGTVFRLCTSSDRPAGLSATFAERMIRGGGTQNPRQQVAAAKRPDGRWVIVAVNTTGGTSDAPSRYLGARYKAATQQLTARIAELAGKNGSFVGQKCSVAGAIGAQQSYALREGHVRFTLAAGETVAMVGGA